MISHYKNTLAILFTILFLTSTYAEQEEIYLQSISDQIVITKDLKTLEKAVYQNLMYPLR